MTQSAKALGQIKYDRDLTSLQSPEEDGHCPTRSLVAVQPRRPPMTDVGTETAFTVSDWTSASISEKVNISWGQRSIDAIKPV